MTILGRVYPADIDASTLHQFYDDKVEGIRSPTYGSVPPVFMSAPAGCELRIFTPITEADALEMVKSLPDKQCSLDPMVAQGKCGCAGTVFLSTFQ